MIGFAYIFSWHRQFPASGRTLGQFWCWSEILGVKDQISFVETPHVSSASEATPPRSSLPPSQCLQKDCSPAASRTLTTLTSAADTLAFQSDSATIPASISACQYTPDIMCQAGVDALLGAALGGSPPVPSSALESAASPEKSSLGIAEPSTAVMSALWNQELVSTSGPNDKPDRLKTTPRRGLRTLQPCKTTDEEPKIEKKAARSLRTCPHCHIKVPGNNYCRHLSTHSSKSQGKKCDLCGQALRRGDNMMRHKEKWCKR